MFRVYPSENFREVEIGYTLKFKYAVSNRGRFASFSDKIENGRLLKGGNADGYKIFRFRVTIDGKITDKHLFIYKLVAQSFIPKTSEDQNYVLHLDYVRDNDNIANLKWATRPEMIAHSNKSPNVILQRKNCWSTILNRTDGNLLLHV